MWGQHNSHLSSLLWVISTLTHNRLSCAVRWKRKPWRGCNWCQSILYRSELCLHQRYRWMPYYSDRGQFWTAKIDINERRVMPTKKWHQIKWDKLALMVILTISSSWRQTESSSLPNLSTTTFSATPLITSSMSFLHVNLGKNKLIFEESKLTSAVC